jgi:glycosyltransferase involved in cell wall biosynthesis
MKLIDCTYLNSAGGTKILEIILNKMSLELINEFTFLIDSRANNTILKRLEGSKFQLIENSELKRRSFYKLNKNKIIKCICLANVPPPIRTSCETIIYFHNDLILKPNLSQSLYSYISFSLKKLYIRIVNHNNYKWVVQTELMKKKLSKNLKIKNQNILVYPIFTEFSVKKPIKKIDNTFLYVCSSSAHKNIKRLIEAFNTIKNINSKTLNLDLTISDENYFRKVVLANNKNKNLVINNHTNLNESSLNKLYKKSEFLIYPSLIESFGLPLVESIQFNCKIIASNLPYVHELVDPSKVFNPFSISAIAKSIDDVIESDNIIGSKIKIKNKIDKFIELIYS